MASPPADADDRPKFFTATDGNSSARQSPHTSSRRKRPPGRVRYPSRNLAARRPETSARADCMDARGARQTSLRAMRSEAVSISTEKLVDIGSSPRSHW